MYLGDSKRLTKGEDIARIQVVPETGVQVCVVGPCPLATLGIKTTLLVRCGFLRDVANVSLKPMGEFTCHIRHGNTATTQDVFVMKTGFRYYISLQVCKDLFLVHADSPHQPVAMASVAVDVGNAAHESADSAPPRPVTIPFPPLEENARRLEDCLFCHFLVNV